MANDLVADILGLFGRSRKAPEDPLASATFRRVGADGESFYGKFAYRSELSVGAFPRAQEFDAVGDHLLLDELVGSEALYVKVGDWGNPWTRLEEGDVLKRRFTKVWITTGAASDALLPAITRSQVEATFLHSWGELKRKGEKSYAFRRGFKTFEGTASTTEQSLFDPLILLVPGVALVFGKRGGTVAIRNSDSANSLLVRHGLVGVLGSENYWEIYPGEIHVFRVGSRIHSTTDTIVVATRGGACKYSFLTSAFDIDRADLDQTIMPGS